MAEQGFHDYTLATNLERLVAQIEQCFRGWMLTGLENISHMPPATGADKHPMSVVRVSNSIKHRLPWRKQPYILTLHVPYTREAELQAARQEQQQQQQQREKQRVKRQQQQQQARQAAAAAAAASDAAASRTAPRIPGGDGHADAAKLQQQLGPLLEQLATHNAASSGGGGAGNEQLQQQVHDLIAEYTHLAQQLEQDEQQADGGGEGGAQRAVAPSAAVDAGQVRLSAAGGEGSAGGGTAAGVAAERAGSEGGAGKSLAAAAAAAVDALSGLAAVGRGGRPPAGEPGRGGKPGRPRRSGSRASASDQAAVAVEGEAEAEEEGDEVSSRLVELPAPEQLALPGSQALAAVREAVRQDQSRTAVSRTWWPQCFDVALVQQQQQQQQCEQPARPGQALPSLKAPWWAPTPSMHKLQRWFGLDLFVLLQPSSFSRRLLDQAEASSLLSVGQLALSSSGVAWPLLMPVHDALRDAYCGVAQVGGCSVYFSTDSIHISRLPRHLAAPEQQLSVFAEQLAGHNPAAAAACLAALGQAAQPGTGAAAAAAGSHRYWNSTAAAGGGGGGGSRGSGSTDSIGGPLAAGPAAGGGYCVWMSACFTFKLPNASKHHWLHEHYEQQQEQQQQQQQRWQYTGADGPPLSPRHFQQQLQQQSGLGVGGSAGHAGAATGEQPDDEDLECLDWDSDTPWHPWAQHADPVEVMELDVVWEDRRLQDGGEAAAAAAAAAPPPLRPGGRRSSGGGGGGAAGVEEAGNAAPPPPGAAASPAGVSALHGDLSAADHWVLHVAAHGFSSSPLRHGRLGMRSADRHRRHVKVAATGADWLWSAEKAAQVLSEGGRLSGVCPQPWGFNLAALPQQPGSPPMDPGSFATMLSALMTARTAAGAARSLWELAGADWWEARGEQAVPKLPPDSVLDAVLRDLLSPARGGGGGVPAARQASGQLPAPDGDDGAAEQQQPGGTLPRAAPPGSLLCRLARHALVFGNARAVASLWQRFVMQVRLQFWEQRTLLPYMPAGDGARRASCSSSGGGGGGQQQGRRSSGADSAPAAALEGCGSSPLDSLAWAGAGAGPGGSARPAVPAGPPSPDLDSCLLHQKLQMLNLCIWRRDRRLTRGLSQQQQQAAAAMAAAPQQQGQQQEQQEQQQQQQQRAASNGGSSNAPTAGSRSTTPEPAEDAARPGSSGSSSGDGSTGGGGMPRAPTGASSSFFSLPSDAANGGNGGDEEASEQQQRLASDAFEDACSEFATAGEPGGRPPPPPALQEADDGEGEQAACGDGGAPDASEPRGVAGVVPGQSLLRHPDRPLRVPVVQDDQLFTKDQVIQRHAALLQLSTASASQGGRQPGGGGAELLVARQRLLAAPLLSDMSAFKAANPGCCLEDFLRWHSPKDWLAQQERQDGGGDDSEEEAEDGGRQRHERGREQSQVAAGEGQQEEDASEASSSAGASEAGSSGAPAAPAKTRRAASSGQLSARMAGGGNSWRQLWELAPPQPAAQQRPLLNPQKEGELVLHYLETLGPGALFSQLLAAAVCEALALLAASRGAALPAAAAVVDRFRAMAAGVLRKGGGLSEALATAEGAGAAAAAAHGRLAGDWQGADEGLSDAELELLLAEFAYVEHVVVLAESLLHRLPGQRQLASRLLGNLLQGGGAAAGSEADAAVLGAGCRLPVARLAPEEQLGLMAWVAACGGGGGGGGGSGGLSSSFARRGSSASASAQHHQRLGYRHEDADEYGSADGGQAAAVAAPAAGAGASSGGEQGGAGAAAAAGQRGLLQALRRSCPGAAAGNDAGGWAAELRELQGQLGDAAQREWVLTCGRPPSARGSGGAPGGGAGPPTQQRLRPAVAAAVAAAGGGGSGGAGAGGCAPAARAEGPPTLPAGAQGGAAPGRAAPEPPSRMYVQEADGEMRLALLLASEPGL